MKIMIQVNRREPESLRRFYVTKNDKVVKSMLTLQEAQSLQKRLKEKSI